MNAAGLLRIQLEGNRNQLAECLEGLTDAEWRARPYFEANRVGFTAWHLARTADWGLNTCLLGRSEVADQPSSRTSPRRPRTSTGCPPGDSRPGR